MTARLIFGFVLLMPIISPAAPPAPRRGGDGPRAAVVRFFDAVASGDEDRIMDAIRVPMGDRRMVARLLAGPMRLEAAAVQRFGESGKRLRAGYDLILPGPARTAAAVNALIIPESDRRVRLYLDRRPSPTIATQDDDGHWQIELFASDYDDLVDARIKATVQAQQQVIAAIQAGKYKDVDQAQADLVARLLDIQDNLIKLAR